MPRLDGHPGRPELLFPILALGTLLFVVWVAVLTVALLRSTRTESRVAPRVDDISRISSEPNAM